MSIKTGRAEGNAQITINKEACTSCGLCVSVCKGTPLFMENNTVQVDQSRLFGCIGCGQCMAVCPAGETQIGEFLEDRKSYDKHYQKPFRALSEVIYAVKGSDAEQYVLNHFPEKTVKLISNGLRPLSIEMFLGSLPMIFQANQSEGMDVVYHFSFTGNESRDGTVKIKDKTITVEDGLNGIPNIHVTADSQTWIRFLAKEANLFLALITRKIKIKGSPRLMKDFAKCFPA